MQHTRRRIKRLYVVAAKEVKQSNYDAAWPYISEILNVDMDNAGGLYLAGIYMRHKGAIGLAAQMFRRCVSIAPKDLNPWMHFGSALHDLHQFQAAQQVWDMLAHKSPLDYGVWRNMAGTYLQKGNYHEALNKINKAMELLPGSQKPSDAMLAIKGLACLGLGRWEEGFDLYRGLYSEQIRTRKYCEPVEPEWDGTPGQVVVVQGDQGIGDEIRFGSVMPDVSAACKKVIWDCHPRLEGILRRSFPGMAIHGTRKKVVANWLGEHHDIEASHHISSLGRFFRKRDGDFPRKPYLVPSAEMREKWRERLKNYPRPLIGLAWAGGVHQTMREHRSFDLQTFFPIIQEGGSFVDLSYHDSKEEVEYYNSLAENKVLHFDVDQDDYDDTVALIAELDLVICVPTTVLHACGAIGRDCWVYHPHYPFWEFGHNRDDMIWYAPGQVRLFRGTIEELRDAYLHRYGLAAAASIHRAAELDHSPSEQAGADHSADPPATTHY